MNRTSGFFIIVVTFLSFAISADAQTYCVPAVASTFDDEIRYVMFGAMSNTTSCGVTAPGPGSIANEYSNFTGSTGIPNVAGTLPTATYVAGNSYPLSVGLTMCNSIAYLGVIGAFIDYDKNGNFSGPGELVWTSSYGPGAVSPAFVVYSAPGVGITIPCTASTGLTRLRIWESETSSMTGPCGAITWGEVEDYAIYIVSSPSVNITVSPSNPTVCPGGTVALTASGGVSYSWSGGITNGIPFTPTTSAVYSVSVGGGTCSSTATVFVNYSSPLTTIGPTTNICANTSATLLASGGTTYTWSTGATTSSIVVSPSVTTVYTVAGTSAAGCNVQSLETVSVTASVPSLTVITSNGTSGTCPNTPVSLYATGATTYSWTGGITNGVLFTILGPSTYTVTGANACGVATTAVSLSIHPLPTVTASVNNPTVCSGNSVILNSAGAATYTWTPFAQNNVAFFPGVTTTYTVIGTSALGCTANAVQGVTVLIAPTIAPVVTPTAICMGAVATLSASGATGFTWTPGTGLNAPTATVSPPVSTTYTLFRTNGPCANTSTVNLIVYPLPPVNVSATASQICAGTGVNIIITGPVTNTTFPPGFNSSNFMVYPNTSTSYTVVGANANCTAQVIISVSVNPSPTISILSSTNTICEGQNVTLSVNGAGALSYTWQPVNSNNTSVILSPLSTSTVSVSATNSLSCITTQTQLIVVNPLPNMSINSSSPFICAGQSAILSLVNPSNNIVYSWSTGVYGTSVTANPTVTTSYFVTGTNSITGCQNTNTIVLSVYISTFVVNSPVALCKGSTATLTATGPAANYSWTANGGMVSPSITVSPLVNTTYYVTGITGGCSTTQSVNVIINPLPSVTASLAKNTICRFEISTITGNGAVNYVWNTGASTPTISLTLSLTTTYTLTGTDLNGCSKTVTITQFVATCIGIESIESDTNPVINIYPNPNNGNFIVSSDVTVRLSIVNMLGQVIRSFELTEENKNELKVNDLPNGLYFFRAEHGRQKIIKKIVVEK